MSHRGTFPLRRSGDYGRRNSVATMPRRCIFPLRRSGDYGRRNSRATMLLRRRWLCFRPAGVDLSSGEKNRSWRTNAAARHVGSVALVFYPPELRAHTESFRTSERGAASGEASPICTQWRFFTQTEGRPSAAKKLGDDSISTRAASTVSRWLFIRRI